MSTIVLADQIVVGLGSGDVLSLPDTSGLGNKQVSIEVVGSATLRPATGGKINGSTGDTVLTEGSYVLSTTGNSGAGWTTLQGSSGVAGVTSVSGTSGQISSTGGTTPVLAFAWSASANQLVGLNSGGTAYEGKTLFAGANMSINHTANGVTFTASGGGGGGLYPGSTVSLNATDDGPTYNATNADSFIIVTATNDSDAIEVILPAVSTMQEGQAVCISVNTSGGGAPELTVSVNGADTASGISSVDSTSLILSPPNANTNVAGNQPIILVAHPSATSPSYQWQLLGNVYPNGGKLYILDGTIVFASNGTDPANKWYNLQAGEDLTSSRTIVIQDPGGSSQLALLDSITSASNGSFPYFSPGPGSGGRLLFNGALGAGDKRQGVATTSGGTVTVNTTAVTATCLIFLTPQHSSPTTCTEDKASRVNSTSFVIETGADCDVAWMIVEP